MSFGVDFKTVYAYTDGLVDETSFKGLPKNSYVTPLPSRLGNRMREF